MHLFFLLFPFAVALLGRGVVDGSLSACAVGGEWEDDKSQHHNLRVQAVARTSLAVVKEKERKKILDDWHREACVAETAMHSCYARGDEKRAAMLEGRRWRPKSSACRSFRPADFLLHMQGRKLLLYGDSVTMQVWQALVCATSSVADAVVDIDWFRHNASTQLYYNDQTCPFGAEHCHLHGGTAHFRGFNVSLTYKLFGFYERIANPRNSAPLYNAYVPGLLAEIATTNSLGQGDVLVTNFGLHAHRRGEYRERLTNLAKDHRERAAVGGGFPRVFFLETFPQHFFGPSGYYDLVEREDAVDMICHKLPEANRSTSRALDWKNTMAREILAGGGPEVIPVAEALRSQWDAHVQLSKVVNMAQADCTHWCSPSGVFTFVLTMLYNAVGFE